MWIGFDFDGTLAEHCGGQLQRDPRPIGPMVDVLKRHLAAGHECRILTARVSNSATWPTDPESVVQDEWHRNFVQDWLEARGLPRLKVQCHKDFTMAWLYDDRAVQVVTNEGRISSEVLPSLD